MMRLPRRSCLFASILFGCAALAAGPDAAPPKNILIVCINCLRKDRVGAYSRVSNTPNIDALAKSGAFVFKNYVTRATWTEPCLFELFTARDFRRGGRRILETLHVNKEITDPGAMLGDISLLDSGAMLAPGGKPYNCLWSYRQRLDQVLELNVIRTIQPPFVMFCHTTSLHIPFATARDSVDPRTAVDALLPSSHEHYLKSLAFTKDPKGLPGDTIPANMSFMMAAFGAETALCRKLGANYGWIVNEQLLSAWRGSPTYDMEIDILRRLYGANVRATDCALGRLLALLKRRGLLDSTIVVIMGDHGEHLMERGYLEHWMPYDEVISPPLIVKVPGMLTERKSIEEQVWTRHLLPTLLALAGVTLNEKTRKGIDGRSLLPLLRGKREDIAAFAVSERRTHMIRKNDGWKLIWHRTTGKKELYNVKTDPGERRDLAGKHPEIQAALEEELLLHVLGAPQGGSDR